MDQLVRLNYRNDRLEDVLKDISRKYDVRFSYSIDYIPVNNKVALYAWNETLATALDILIERNRLPIAYRNIGDQIVFKRDDTIGFQEETKEEYYSYEEKEPAPVLTASLDSFEKLEPLEREKHIPPLESPKYTRKEDETLLNTPVPAPQTQKKDGDFKAQVSIVPTLGTNGEVSEEVTNNVSFNLLSGKNGGVEGVEIGGLTNYVQYDMNGVQVAGLVNVVGGDVGTSKYIDESRKTVGVQAAGLVNIAGNVNAIQVAGLVNVTKGGFSGVQLAGLGNHVAENANGVQVAGLYNVNKGNGQYMAAGILNIAKDVKGNQVSGLVNKGRNVDGFQLGLINIADSVRYGSFGLINIVKKGYNRFEIFGGEALHANLAYKFGSHQWYNVIQIGRRIDNKTWGIGYGFGTISAINDKLSVNYEISASQINENGGWTNKLNLLNQFRVTADFKVGKGSSFFIGPTMNVMVSKLYNAESQIYGSTLATYTLYDNLNNDLRTTDIKMWIGLNAGWRF